MSTAYIFLSYDKLWLNCHILRTMTKPQRQRVGKQLAIRGAAYKGSVSPVKRPPHSFVFIRSAMVNGPEEDLKSDSCPSLRSQTSESPSRPKIRKGSRYSVSARTGPSLFFDPDAHFDCAREFTDRDKYLARFALRKALRVEQKTRLKSVGKAEEAWLGREAASKNEPHAEMTDVMDTAKGLLDPYVSGAKCWFPNKERGWISGELKDKRLDGDQVELSFTDEDGNVRLHQLTARKG